MIFFIYLIIIDLIPEASILIPLIQFILKIKITFYPKKKLHLIKNIADLKNTVFLVQALN